jgi:hypothetical protein
MKAKLARQLRVLLAILYFPLMAFLQAARDVVSQVMGNANYPTPFPALTDITAALDDLEAKITAAAGGDRTAMAARNSAWETAKSLIRQLASYVQMHCQNDLTILLTSGFTATKAPAPVGLVGTPLILRLVRTALSGQILLTFKPVYGTTAGYEIQVAASADGPFTDYVTCSSSRNVKINGRPTMATTWVRVRAIGATGPGGWSDPASITVL